ncbi:MAG: phosphate/phosphite/phosphonate ABC transporter substrate-binding protein [Deltaproteobacteria bacterium]|nr:phosphate/phosphite/phosphonate ABC transporter substrate-binding protein [Deltaproteobacteria bacterium]
MLGCPPSPYREVEVDLSEANSDGPATRHAEAASTLRFSVAAMQSPRDTYAAYSKLFSRVGLLLGAHVEFVQRRTYREVNDLLLDGTLDAALLCTGGYFELEGRAPVRVEPIAVPVVDGKTTYHSFIIVPADSPATGIEDLRGKRFAFTDELSFSGRAYAVHLLRRTNEAPARFFGDTIFTHSHDRSVEAVASGIVDGAAVDNLIYESIATRHPEVGAKIRVIHRSPPFGMLPLIASPTLPETMRARLRRAILTLDRDAEAAAALRIVGIERFVVPEPGLFESARVVMEDAL